MNSQPGQLLAPNRRRSISDPLAAALLPPPNESPEERERRLDAEAEAKKRSDNIDRMLRETRAGEIEFNLRVKKRMVTIHDVPRSTPKQYSYAKD